MRKRLSGSRILDVGCGWDKLVPGAIGIDTERIPGLYVASANHLPFQDNSFDHVVMLEVIEHVDDPAEVIMDVKRVLKPGGELFISTPNNTVVWRFIWWAWSGTLGVKWKHLHRNHFTETSFEEFLGQHFEQIEFGTVNRWIISAHYRKMCDGSKN